jgi:hypothetical protein
MSERAFKHSRSDRRLCQRCQDRKAKFQFRGEVRADRDHTLCFECFRSQREQNRARALTKLPAAEPLRAGIEPRRVLGDQQVMHRLRMLAHLQGLAQ